jgi:ADP-heptose:LPS heptosyltransferase
MRQLILTNYQAPGDLLMLTAAVRDLHACYPRQFVTDVRTSCPELWENNPHVIPLDPRDPKAETIPCEYPLIHRSDRDGAHFIHGFIEFLNERLDLRIRPTAFRGDIHLSAEEKSCSSPVEELTGADLPYWIIVAGGKYDYTIKWWHFRRWQAIVDHFRGRLLFVQVGKRGDYHPPLRHVIDLRGRTTLRDTVRLMHHAQGVICPVTFHMHLAAAVEPRCGKPGSRPCVVVAGGRESPHWEAYPAHQFIHTVGALSCCDTSGCWRSRVMPLGDGDSKDGPEHLCVDVTRGLPRCMDLITPAEVIDRIERYLAGGRAEVLDDRQWKTVLPFLRTDSGPVRTIQPKARATAKMLANSAELATNCS